MELSVDDIIDFIEKEIEISQGKKLSDKEVVDFIERLQTKIAQMDFSVPEGTAKINDIRELPEKVKEIFK